MKQLNILYVLGPSSLSKWNNNEIRYSLRSLNNAPVGWIGIAGPEMPAFLTGIEHIRVPHQEDGSRYHNTQRQILAACSKEHLPEDMVLFNDDFIVRGLEHWDWPTMHRGAVLKRDIAHPWKQSVVNTIKWLEARGIADPVSYEGHTPFPFSKTLAKPLLENILSEKEILQFRTAYGNLNHIGGKRFPNAKREDPSKWPANFPFWSLPSEPSEKAKRFLERWLNKPSRWEV